MCNVSFAIVSSHATYSALMVERVYVKNYQLKCKGLSQKGTARWEDGSQGVLTQRSSPSGRSWRAHRPLETQSSGLKRRVVVMFMLEEKLCNSSILNRISYLTVPVWRFIYASLSVCARDDGANTFPILNEVSMLQHLKKCAAAEDYPGLLVTRLADDIFEINMLSGPHYCTLELMEGRNPFDPINHVHNQYVLPLALAQRIAYLGPPTLTLIQQSPIFLTYLGKYGCASSLSIHAQTSEDQYREAHKQIKRAH
ncbi:conserved hypothetical protein [Histoplasma capsulatum G186AR]|uniref:Uncharacterized protein n=1 Tax=Ajellomyces capsulatus (strain G186AR / H82 / ATCC MYA-2454 / RMSCC 2432) TaxID=447093 RepID=C0NYS4_AJECG|nr:uncharacterized protein HCBG_08304 [Histoplasma capsulatum G186AR]EEH03364.1 conserved hypothetical protein [Histoplasma capsulatum G186AR]